MSQLNGKGLKTEAGAWARINKLITSPLATSLITNSFTLVAVQDGRYFPVVILSDNDAPNAFAIASSGVHAMKY